jgi:hypothetical protein
LGKRRRVKGGEMGKRRRVKDGKKRKGYGWGKTSPFSSSVSILFSPPLTLYFFPLLTTLYPSPFSPPLTLLLFPTLNHPTFPQP